MDYFSYMKLLLTLAIAAFATSVFAQSLTVGCSNYYPEPEYPTETIVVAEVVVSADGTPTGLFCSIVTGPYDNCPKGNVTCCPCNVIRGVVPECSVKIEYTEDSAHGSCFQDYSHGSTDGAFVTTTTTSVTPLPSRKHKKKKSH